MIAGIFPGEGIIVEPDKDLGIFISRDLNCSHTLKPVCRWSGMIAP
jgi:hypothetical protein